MKSFVFTIIVLLLTHSCNYKQDVDNNKVIIAEVVGEYKLYSTDIDVIAPKFANSSDSINYMKDYINSWIKQKLILSEANKKLSKEEKDKINKTAEEYKNSLLTHKYKQQIINENFNDSILEEEIIEYFDKYKENFNLHTNIVKVTFLKVYKDAPDLDKIKKWIISDEKDSKNHLEKYAIQYAKIFDNSSHKWLSFTEILREVSLKINNPAQFLKTNKYIETEDDSFHYFLYIKDYCLINTPPPLSYIKDKITVILKNKKKIEFIENIENETYQKAFENNKFVIYK